MRNDLIRAILECGVDDLRMLDDAGADIFDIIGQMKFEGIELTLNNIMAEVFKDVRQTWRKSCRPEICLTRVRISWKN